MKILLRYKFSFHFLVVISLFIFSSTYSQQVNKILVPNWVIKRQVDIIDLTKINVDAGSIVYFLDDQQSYYDNSDVIVYTQQKFQLRTLQAIEQMGTITIQYNPAYQDYQIHHINVIRNGKTIDMTPAIRTTVNSYNAEANTSDHEGENIVQMYISDLRRDDILDFAYSINGQNPAFGNKTFGVSYKAAALDVNNVYRTIRLPKDRKINIQTMAGHEMPAISNTNNETIYEWFWETVSQTVLENGVPIWHPSIPTATYSEFKNWQEVALWGYDLFEFENITPVIVKEMADSLTQNAKSDLDKLLSIFSFMQKEVRYTGLEIGRNGFRPFPPSEVLVRRYGDCKDQTVLLMALLRAVNIDATAALVNSISGKLVLNYNHSPLAFNHVIVRAKIGDDIYWLDPTIALSQDKPADLTPPRYIYALVIEQDTDDLVEIPLTEKDIFSPHVQVTDRYSIRNGVFGKLRWNRTTRYSGAIADFIRSNVEYIGERQVGINLRTSHQNMHENIESEELTKFVDQENFFEINEKYTAPKAGEFDETKNLTMFAFAPRNIAELLASPANISERKNPFSLTYPARRQSIVYLDIPGATFYDFNKRIQNPFFTFEFRGWYEGRTFKMIYEFETHQDHVPVDQIKRFKEDINLALGDMFIYVASIGNIQTKAMEVYQPVLNQNSRLVDSNNMDVHQKIETFINTGGLEYLEESREEILDILNDEELTIKASDEFLLSIIRYALETGQVEQAYSYHAIHVKTNGIITYELLMQLLQSLVENEQYEKVEDVLLKEIEDHSQPVDSESAGYLQHLLREIYWHQKKFIKLKAVLQHLTHYFPAREIYYKELKVVHYLLGENDKVKEIGQIMTNMGFKEPEILPANEASKYFRNPRRLVNVAPIYPLKAEFDNVEGYAIVQYTIKETGEATDCKVIESTGRGYFDKAACDAVTRSYYYPTDLSEPTGEITNYKQRINFEFSQ